MCHGRLDGLVRQGSENLCVMGQTPMLLAPSAAISQPPGLKRRRSAFYTRTARATGLAEPAERYRTKTGDFFLGYKNSPRLGGRRRLDCLEYYRHHAALLYAGVVAATGLRVGLRGVPFCQPG